MYRFLLFSLISIFSIFFGSQIAEGFLLVPHWQSLSPTDFYEYYTTFGPKINRFYTVLTLAALLISIGVSLHCFLQRSKALTYALISTAFALLVIALFYIYLKDINQRLLREGFTKNELPNVLLNWELWHWARVIFEFLSLTFLSITCSKLLKENTSTPKALHK